MVVAVMYLLLKRNGVVSLSNFCFMASRSCTFHLSREKANNINTNGEASIIHRIFDFGSLRNLFVNMNNNEHLG